MASASQAMHFNAYSLAYILVGLSYTQITLTKPSYCIQKCTHCTLKSWRNCSACMRFSLFLMCFHVWVRVIWGFEWTGWCSMVLFSQFFFLCYYGWCCDIRILFENSWALVKLKFKSNLINIHWNSLTYHNNEYGFHFELEIMLTTFNLRILWWQLFHHRFL